MITDKFGRSIFEPDDIFQLLYQNKLISIDKIQSIASLETENIPNLKVYKELSLSIEEFDNINQSIWFMPQEYIELDIKTYVINLCPPWDPDYSRTIEELAEFESRNMLNLIRWLKYFVDTARSNNILWGVGRGSSVASYVLYLLGVHKINSIKYNLDWREFLR